MLKELTKVTPSRGTPKNIRANGDEEARTPDLRRAKAALSQLSYIPFRTEVGLVGLEPTTSPLSEERSNRLSYRPKHGRPQINQTKRPG